MIVIVLIILLFVAIPTFIACLVRITIEGRYTAGVLLAALTSFAVIVGILSDFSRDEHRSRTVTSAPEHRN
jgi:hypothetical protein